MPKEKTIVEDLMEDIQNNMKKLKKSIEDSGMMESEELKENPQLYKTITNLFKSTDNLITGIEEYQNDLDEYEELKKLSQQEIILRQFRIHQQTKELLSVQKFREAIQLMKKELAMLNFIGNGQGVVFLLDIIASTYFIMGDEKSAVKYAEFAVQVADDIQDVYIKIRTLISLVQIQIDCNELENAQKSLSILKNLQSNVRNTDLSETIKDLDLIIQKRIKLPKVLNLTSELKGDNIPPNLGLGILLTTGMQKFDLKQYRESIQYLTRAFEVSPKFFDICIIIAESHIKLGNYNSAIEWCEKGLKLQPETCRLYMELGYIHQMLGNKQKSDEYFQKAIFYGEKTISREPFKSEDYGNLGWVYALMGNVEECIRYSKNSIEVSKNRYSEHQYHNIGYAYKMRGEYENAIKYFNRAIEINPDHTDAWFDKGECYEKLGNTSEAIRMFEESVKLDPNWIIVSNKLKELKKDSSLLSRVNPNAELTRPGPYSQYKERNPNMNSPMDFLKSMECFIENLLTKEDRFDLNNRNDVKSLLIVGLNRIRMYLNGEFSIDLLSVDQLISKVHGALTNLFGF